MVQAANFRAKTGHTKRPITKLYPLKVSAKETKQDKQSDSNGETDRPIATTGLIMRRSEPNSTKENRSLESEEQNFQMGTSRRMSEETTYITVLIIIFGNYTRCLCLVTYICLGNSSVIKIYIIRPHVIHITVVCLLSSVELPDVPLSPKLWPL